MSVVKASYLDLLDNAHDTVVVFVASAQDPRSVRPEKVGLPRTTPTHEGEG